MTPMVDLAFLLLTFFMLTTTFAKPQVMDITMPVKDPNEEVQTPVKASNALTIILGENNQLYYYEGLLAPGEAEPTLVKSDYSSDGIRKVLLQKRVNPDLVVMIKPHEESRYTNVVDILDEMAITNIKKYAIVDITEEDKEFVEKNAAI